MKIYVGQQLHNYGKKSIRLNWIILQIFWDQFRSYQKVPICQTPQMCCGMTIRCGGNKWQNKDSTRMINSSHLSPVQQLLHIIVVKFFSYYGSPHWIKAFPCYAMKLPLLVFISADYWVPPFKFLQSIQYLPEIWTWVRPWSNISNGAFYFPSDTLFNVVEWLIHLCLYFPFIPG